MKLSYFALKLSDHALNLSDHEFTRVQLNRMFGEFKVEFIRGNSSKLNCNSLIRDNSSLASESRGALRVHGTR